MSNSDQIVVFLALTGVIVGMVGYFGVQLALTQKDTNEEIGKIQDHQAASDTLMATTAQRLQDHMDWAARTFDSQGEQRPPDFGKQPHRP